jgi:DNA repair protein RecN (Recombination protein N)
MLETLIIRNVAVIDSAEIPFKGGLNILSGETGAGKSIVIEAIGLLLGSRANAELVRTGCDDATVEGLFDLKDLEWMRKRLETLGLPSEGDNLIIRRVVSRAGRHRIYVNGALCTLAVLQELCEGLVDLCGQHEHQSLLKPSIQLELLDRYGGLLEKTRKFGEAFQEYRSLEAERAKLEQDEGERTKRSDFLKFQIHELSEANLREDEDALLASEKQLLQSAESRVQTADSVRGVLEDEEAGILNGLRGALNRLRNLEALDGRVSPWKEGLERGVAEIEEVALGLNRYVSSVDLNPERLNEVQERLALLAELRRKYGTTVREMLETLARLEGEASTLGLSSSRLESLGQEIESLRRRLEELARELGASRRKIAEVLARSVTAELAELKMGQADFGIELDTRESIETWNAQGSDAIQFVVRTNLGEPARPLGKIASGGELSRLMLAIRRVIADRGGIGVYLFDEIDAGIGGQTAFEVGRKLKSVAGFNQVICITHLPQVASFADHHLTVRKTIAGKRTVTEVLPLNLTERKQELARMLGGPQLSKKSLDAASELIEMART